MIQRLLVVGPHQDDELLGCTALMCRVMAQGGQVAVLSLAQKVFDHQVAEVQTYQAQLLESMNLLDAVTPVGSKGSVSVIFKDFETEIFDDRWRELMVVIAEEVTRFRPDALAIPWRMDLHQDHRATSTAARFAARGLGVNGIPPVPVVLEYEVLGSTDQQYDEAFCPSVFVTYSQDVLELKQKALAVFKKEMRDYPLPRSLRGLEIQARYRGMQCGAEFAESFKLYRAIV